MNFKSATVILAVMLSAFLGKADDASRYASHYENLPFEMPTVTRPVFPDRSVNIADCGAIGNGSVLNTVVINNTIDSLSALGGGRVIIPAGIWLTGPVILKSNIDFHLEDGAVLAFSADVDLYGLIDTSYEGLNMKRTQSPLSGHNLVNVAITGKGAIDGAGDKWRPLKRGKASADLWKARVASGGYVEKESTWYPSEYAARGPKVTVDPDTATIEQLRGYKQALRPVMVSLVGCKNVLLEDALFQNSPAWNIHPLLCENLIIDNILVRNPSFAQNGDGIDVESCRNVLVINTTLDVGDDAICIKSGKDEDGRNRGVPCENVIVDNCRVFQGHGGFVVGSEMSGGVKNISVSNCRFIGTDVGLRFKSQRGRGGVVENIYIRDINMYDITNEALLFDLYYFTKKTDVIPAVDITTPEFRDIYINNVVSHNSGQSMYFNGLPEKKISGIHVTDSYFSSRRPARIVESEKITIENVTLITPSAPALELENVDDVKIENLTVAPGQTNSIAVSGTNSGLNLPR
ncbi:MAG: glycoside hydrolase family 28 protein [Lachnoclostridium sp.]|nr:glycoside hydrolase family 28 protein [Lachnoclostridium sp.]